MQVAVLDWLQRTLSSLQAGAAAVQGWCNLRQAAAAGLSSSAKRGHYAQGCAAETRRLHQRLAAQTPAVILRASCCRLHQPRPTIRDEKSHTAAYQEPASRTMSGVKLERRPGREQSFAYRYSSRPSWYAKASRPKTEIDPPTSHGPCLSIISMYGIPC